MNIVPNECAKDCDKDASNGTTAETRQTNTSFGPSNEERRLSQKSFASHFRVQWRRARSHSVLYSVFWVFRPFEKKLLARLKDLKKT